MIAQTDAVYAHLPIALQHVACTVKGWHIQQSRFDHAFDVLLREAERRAEWSEDHLLTYRDRRLTEFVRHAAQTVPAYRRLLNDHGVSPGDVRGFDDLSRLPIIGKEDVRRSYSDSLSKTTYGDEITVHTSGTTGAGFRFVTTKRAIQEQWAIWWRYRKWHGILPGTWCAYFGGRSVVPLRQETMPFWRYNYAAKQILFSTYHMSHRNLSSYVDELRRKQPPWFHGYPSALALVAGYLIEHNLDLGYDVRWVTMGSENVLPQQASSIREAFGVQPRENYGMAEAVANASQCELGSLHIDEDFAAVEVIPGWPGSASQVIGTNFTNWKLPMIRYTTGDHATLSSAPCGCGRPGRVLSSLDGRMEDYVILPNGARIGRLDHIFKDLVHITEAQIYQPSPRKLVMRVVPRAGYTRHDERILLTEARKRLGADMDIRISYASRLDRSATGKLRFVISDVL